MSERAGLPNVPEYTVGEVSAALRRTVESAFDRVRVRGEVSGFKRAASGHLYMSLKEPMDEYHNPKPPIHGARKIRPRPPATSPIRLAECYNTHGSRWTRS